MADIAELIVALKLQDGVSSGLGRLNGQLRGMQGGLSQVGRGIGQVGRGLDTALTRGALAAAAGLGAVITTAASFEQAFTGVEKTVAGTEAELAELEGTLRQMARTMPVSFEELSAIGEAGGALGIARESLDEFVDVVARLAVSTDLTSEQAATSLGQLGTVLHLSGGEFEDFADSLVALGNAGASTESQIVELAARFAAAGNSAGLSKEEILALASATASMGIEVEAGGTALSQTFNNIATGIGTGAKEINAFTDLLGISAKEFKKRWTEDALGTFTDFLTELAKLDQFEQSAVLEDAGITGVRQLNAIKLMTQNLGFFSDQLAVAENAQGALDKESGKFFDTAQSQWKILQNNVRDAAATIGTEVLPVTKEVLEDLTAALADPANQARLKEFGQNLASGIRDFIKEVKGADFGPLLDTMKGAAAIAKGAFDAFRSLPAPIQQLALAAIVANKVTGGAVGQIAGGLANILTGGLKIALSLRGSSPANPMWVQSVGGPLGGPGGVPVGGAGGGFLGNALKFLPPLIVAGLAAEFSDEIAGLGVGLRTDLAESLNIDLPTFSAADMDWPFGTRNTPTILPGFLDFGPNGFLGGTPPGAPLATPKKTGSRSAGAMDLAAQDRTYQAEDRRPVTAVLPDTAMAPVVAGVATVNTSVQTLAPILKGSDTIVRTSLTANTAEVARNRTETSTRLLALSGNYAGTNARLDRSNASLSTIATKNFSPTINLTNSIRLSPTVIHQRIVQQNVISGVTSNDNSAGI